MTIAGESAGSISVSAQMASPLSKDLIAGAIGESGSLMGTLPPVPLSEAEESGAKFAAKLEAKTLADLRAIPAAKLLEATASERIGRFPLAIDGWFLTKQPAHVFAAGEQAKVPLLVGWNSEEMNYRMILGQEKPTRANYEKAVRKLYGEEAEEVLKHYAATDEQVEQAATDLAGDRFIGLSTWRWADLHGKTGGKPVYRYLYARPRPPMRPEMGDAAPGLAGGVVKGAQAKANRMPPARGAVHSAEIEYALGNLASNTVYAWTPDDHKVSEVMQAYFANFIKSGDPNGPGLPTWPPANRGDDAQVLHIDVRTRAEARRPSGSLSVPGRTLREEGGLMYRLQAIGTASMNLTCDGPRHLGRSDRSAHAQARCSRRCASVMPEKEAAAIIIPFELRMPGVRNDRVSGRHCGFGRSPIHSGGPMTSSTPRILLVPAQRAPAARPCSPLEAMAAAVRTMLRRGRYRSARPHDGHARRHAACRLPGRHQLEHRPRRPGVDGPLLHGPAGRRQTEAKCRP